MYEGWIPLITRFFNFKIQVPFHLLALLSPSLFASRQWYYGHFDRDLQTSNKRVGIVEAELRLLESDLSCPI
jgi:hypothetical protein